MNLKVFYCTKNGSIYAADTNKLQSKGHKPIVVFLFTMLYVIGRNLRIEEIPFSIIPIIYVSVGVGIILGAMFSLSIDRTNQKYFAPKEALKVSKDY